jgi:uncharacterized membrane protein YidH (DUF202 family)
MLMNKTLLSGLVLAGLGIVFLALGNIEFQKQEEVFRLGDLKATATTQKTIPAFRYLGVGFMGGGVALLVLGYQQRRR